MARRAKTFLPPADELDATVVLWGKGEEFYRVHDAVYKGNEFNPSRKGNARFSPIRDSDGRIIPTLYAGTSLDCALMETIFHDVPFVAGFKPLSFTKLEGKVHTVFTPKVDFKLVDLGTIALRRLGVDRAHLIDTTKWHYQETRKWAERFYAQFGDVQGLRWTSRQDDSAQAIMLFGTRANSKYLVVSGPSTPLLAGDLVSAAVINLAIRIGVTLVE
ncbi:MAG: RES family NAD+ phosphorylase [Terracidiphilus sp.]